MKTYKHRLQQVSIVMILALLISFVNIPSQVFAEEGQMTDVAICQLLNILQGEDEGVTEDYLNKSTTRLQAAILSLRLRGLEEVAYKYTGEANFIDSKKVSWEEGNNLLSYLYSNPDLGWIGYYDGSFKPYEAISSQAFYKVMLEALGFFEDDDYTWKDVLEFAKNRGMEKLGFKASLDNRDIATALVEALEAVNVEGDQLVTHLVSIGAVDLSQAIESGLLIMDENQGYLKFYSDDANHRITADGKTVTKITVQLERLDHTIIPVDGVMNVTTTLGKLSSEELVFEDGSASLQLTSIESDTLVTAFLRATLVKVSSATQYEGETGQISIEFDPSEIPEDEKSYAEILSIESDSADRFRVTFSKDVSVSDYVNALKIYEGLFSWEEMLLVGTTAGFNIDGQPVSIVGIEQYDEDTLTFVLNTDHDDDYGPVYDKDITRITKGWTYKALHYLNDNEVHSVTLPKNVGNLLLADATGIDLKTEDNTRPYIKIVDATDPRIIYIEFSDALAEQIVEPTSRGDEFLTSSIDFKINMPGHYGGIMIDGFNFYMTHSMNDASANERAFAEHNKVILVNEIEVGNYLESGDHSGRSFLKIVLDKSESLTVGQHSLNVKWLCDWAGVVDDNNIMLDYSGVFNVIVDSQMPTAVVTAQSPEQWLIQFNEPVEFVESRVKSIELSYTLPTNNFAKFNLDTDGSYTYTSDDYTMTDITSEIDAKGTTLLVEFYKDWSEYFDTSTSYKSYWSSTVSPFNIKFVKEQIKDRDGNFMAESTQTLNLTLDSFSPMIIQATDASSVLDGVLPGEEIIIKMNEPVQIEDINGAPSSVRMTPSEQQTLLSGGIQYEASNVPQPTFEFIQGDVTIQGKVKMASISTEDTQFTVEPYRMLTAGTWSLYMKNLTDDVGNAYNTQKVDVVIPSDLYGVNTPMIAWVGFDNTNKNAPAKQYDYIYIKFSTTMQAIGASGVSRIDNYYLNEKALPVGSSVLAGIPNVTNGWDGVTLKIPADFYLDSDTGGDTEATFNLRLVDNLHSSTGKEIVGSLTVLVGDYTGQSATEQDMLFEAMYLNYSSPVLLNGEIIIDAYGTDGAKDGNIDTIYVTLARSTAMGGSERLMIGNAIYKIITTGNSVNHIFVAEDPNGYLTGTNPSGVDIKSLEGAMIIGMGKVRDKAGPAIKSMTYNGNQTVTLSFSENVKDASIVPGDFNLAGTGIGAETITTVSTGSLVDDGTIELTLSGNPGLVVGETITIAMNLAAVEDAYNGQLSTQVTPVVYIKN